MRIRSVRERGGGENRGMSGYRYYTISSHSHSCYGWDRSEAGIKILKWTVLSRLRTFEESKETSQECE